MRRPGVRIHCAHCAQFRTRRFGFVYLGISTADQKPEPVRRSSYHAARPPFSTFRGRMPGMIVLSTARWSWQADGAADSSELD